MTIKQDYDALHRMLERIINDPANRLEWIELLGLPLYSAVIGHFDLEDEPTASSATTLGTRT
jgi:hypothetical protein